MESMRFFGLLFLFIGAIGFFYFYSQKGLSWFELQQAGMRDHIQQRLSMMFVEIAAEKLTLYIVGACFLPALLIFFLFIPNIIPGLIFGIFAGFVVWKSLRPLVDYFYRRRVNKFVLQMVDALALMSNGLKSGLSVVQSIALVVDEMPNPIKQEFNLVLSQNKLGVSLEDAFLDLGRRVPAEDVEMFVTAVNILKETGGNLSETFDIIVLTIRERIKVESKISAMTAQGFMQGMVVSAIPPLLGFLLYQSDPEFMGPLFTTPLGWMIIAVILVLELVGFFVIMKIVRIEI